MRLQVGRWDKLPHYAVIGEKTFFYVWVCEDGQGSSSKWVKGNEAFQLSNKLLNLFKKDKAAFVSLVKQIHKEQSK